MGLLRFFEIVKEAKDRIWGLEDMRTLEITARYRQQAISRLVAIAKCINEASTDVDFQHSDGLENKVPLILHHANTGLTVSALVKAVDHAVGSITTMKLASSDLGNRLTAPSQPSDPSITLGPLLSCLSSISQTVAGQCTAAPALQDLLQRHGDILLDCWNPDMTWS